MGQSVSLTALPAASAGINVKELEDLLYEKSLSSARFMKCIRARHKHGLVVVKVAMRPPPDFKLTQYARAIKRERGLLADVPNALGYQRIVETENCGYLVRQYLHSSLYDRMSTRPFLENIEKKWLAFQLLCALRDCHTRNVYHGDIKTENILVTSWNWLYLTDFSSSFKKTYLPEDNPADFSYFFDTSGRRTCYLAPERFLAAGEEDDGRGVTWAMDVFSAGCVIAELFVESPIFSLSQLFKYRKGEYDPSLKYLNKIEDTDVKELVSHMIQVEPESRYSAEEYLNFWRRKAFPEYFYSFLHQYMGFITDPSSGHAAVLPETINFGEADDRIDRVYYDFDKISYFLGYEQTKDPLKEWSSSNSTGEVLPVQIDIPNNRHTALGTTKRTVDDGTLIFLSLVVASVRNTARATARIRTCDLLLAFGEKVTDEAKLDRVLPMLVVMLTDKSDAVKIAALRAMTQLLALVNVVSPVNAYVFTEYIRPRLQNMVYSSGARTNPVVRAAYASCLASLAHTSLRLLDMVQALRNDGFITATDPQADDGVAPDLLYQNLYDIARSDLVEHFESHTKALLTDPDPSVRRAFLGSVSSLCVFFGSTKANDVILSHLNTYLNDKDWQLKCTFFNTIVGVATFVGSASLEDFILPLMVQALTNPEEYVVEKVISSFASMAELGLFQRAKIWEMVDIVARFMMHPNIWIREAAAHFVSASITYSAPSDVNCIINPLLRPYLKTALTEGTETAIFDALKKPLPRNILDMAVSWSQKVERGVFWKPAQEQRTFSFGPPEQTVHTISSKDLTPNALRRLPKNEEDEQWLTRLRNLGMSTEDEVKLLALRDYIYRMAARKSKAGFDESVMPFNSAVKLKDLNITPQTVFFESNTKQPALQRRYSQGDLQINGERQKPHTITDALLDASTTRDDTSTQKRALYANGRKQQLGEDPANLTVPAGFSSSRRELSNAPSPLSSSPDSRKPSVDHTFPMSAPPNPFSRIQNRILSDEMPSGGSLTPTELSNGGGPLRIKHKSSAISLLNRRDTQKSGAEIGTDATNAIGQLDTPVTQERGTDRSSLLNDKALRQSMILKDIKAGHTYEGGDPNVTKLLDNLALENFPIEEVDFGPTVTPINRKSIKRADSIDVDAPWRPQGVHVASFGEHSGSINRVLPSPDHVFFITASDDGTVRVWDTLRLERSLVHKSRQMYKLAEGSRVTCISFVENTHTFIGCGSDGSIHVVRIEISYVGDTTKYGKPRMKRHFQLPAGEHAVWSEHFRAENKSTLIIATNKSRILAFDIRTMSLQYTLHVPLDHGPPTTFCLDRKRCWILIGTSHGVLSLHDLRFRILIRAWALAGGTPIHRIALHPFKGRGRWVCVAGGTNYPEITVWDLEKFVCREIFRATGDYSKSISATEQAKEVSKSYHPIPVSEAKSSNISAVPSPNNSLSALAIGIDTPSDERESRYGFLLTGGEDRKVRFWDMSRVEASIVVSGLNPEESQPRFGSSHPTTGIQLNSERGASDSGKERITSKGRVSRVAAISRTQKGLLRAHMDSITDVMVLEGATGMVVSVDQKGCVYVFQ